MFDKNFGKCGQIFKILSPLLIHEKIIYVHVTTISTSLVVFCYTILWNSKIQNVTDFDSTPTDYIDMFMMTLWGHDLTFNSS